MILIFGSRCLQLIGNRRALPNVHLSPPFIVIKNWKIKQYNAILALTHGFELVSEDEATKERMRNWMAFCIGTIGNSVEVEIICIIGRGTLKLGPSGGSRIGGQPLELLVGEVRPNDDALNSSVISKH